MKTRSFTAGEMLYWLLYHKLLESGNSFFEMLTMPSMPELRYFLKNTSKSRVVTKPLHGMLA